MGHLEMSNGWIWQIPAPGSTRLSEGRHFSRNCSRAIRKARRKRVGINCGTPVCCKNREFILSCCRSLAGSARRHRGWVTDEIDARQTDRKYFPGRGIQTSDEVLSANPPRSKTFCSCAPSFPAGGRRHVLLCDHPTSQQRPTGFGAGIAGPGRLSFLGQPMD